MAILTRSFARDAWRRCVSQPIQSGEPAGVVFLSSVRQSDAETDSDETGISGREAKVQVPRTAVPDQRHV